MSPWCFVVKRKTELVLSHNLQTYLSFFVSLDTFVVQFYDQPAAQGTQIALEMQQRFLKNGKLGKGKHFVIRMSVLFIHSRNRSARQKETACKLKLGLGESVTYTLPSP